MVPVDSAIQHGLGEPCEIGPRGEESRMWCNASHSVRILVMHFSVDDPTPPEIILRGCDTFAKRLRRVEHRIVHGERFEHFVLRELIEVKARNALYDLPKENYAEIGVNILAAGSVVERHPANGVYVLFLRLLRF